MPSHLTIGSHCQIEAPPTKKSRFIADAFPVSDETEANRCIEQVRAAFADASHHCFAWRLQEGDRGWRSADDGEPGGTAGQPILARIDGADLRGVLVVVTRYFGGTKLGKGGLIRAYGGAASLVLQQADIIEVRQTKSMRITIAYTDQGAVQGALRAVGLEPLETAFGTEVTITLAVPVEDVEPLTAEIRDRTAGRAQVIFTGA